MTKNNLMKIVAGLAHVANRLDVLGLVKEADYMDRLMKMSMTPWASGKEEVGSVSDTWPSRRSSKWNPVSGEREERTMPPGKLVFAYIEDVDTPDGDSERYYIMDQLEMVSDSDKWEGKVGWEPEDWSAGEWKSVGYHMADSLDALDSADYDPSAEPGKPGSGKALIREYLAEAPQRAREEERFNASWREERAMEAGMLGGIDAYNDEMGWSLEGPEDEW